MSATENNTIIPLQDKRLSILSDLEEFAFYGFPDFDDEQRLTYFEFNESELALIGQSPSLEAKVHAALQLGYFKAKHIFFRLSLQKIPQADLHFVMSHYFQHKTLDKFTITKHEYYTQRECIAKFFGYSLWSNEALLKLQDRAQCSVKLDISPNFIAHELLAFLTTQKIIRPGYSTLQKIVSSTLTQERQRLKTCLQQLLTTENQQNLKQLIENENTLSELAALKQDAKSFGSTMMGIECKKHDVLQPLHDLAKTLLPALAISRQNIAHYASLANYYTINDLARMHEMQAYLYLLCYVFQRYQQISDNLVDAFNFQVKKLEKEIKIKADSYESDGSDNQDKQVGNLLLLYVDDDPNDIHARAFKILPKESIRSIGEKMVKKYQPKRKQILKWQERDKAAARYKHHLRPLFMKLDFKSQQSDNPLLKALKWLKSCYEKQQSLTKQPFENFPKGFISKRIEPYLIIDDPENTDDDGNLGKKILGNRYETLVYLQIMKQIETGAIYINHSIRHRPFAHSLVSLQEKKDILATLDIPWLKIPCQSQLDLLFKELDRLWTEVNHNLKQGTLKHLKYNLTKKELLWVKPKSINEEETPEKQSFYDKMQTCDLSDVLRFANDNCGFLSAFTPLQPRYNKQKIDEDNLIAVMIAQATGIGNHKMAQTSDCTYNVLESTYKMYLRLSTLKRVNEIVANHIASLSIFPHYTFDLDILYGSLDGQKFETITPTIKARYSRKYFKKGRGVVAYTLLSNYVPIQSNLIGAHEHESHFAFDIWYNNTSLITPTVVTGDMHSVNKANFALFHWFGGELRPRFTNLKRELHNVYGTKAPEDYTDFLVQPAGQLDKQVMLDEGDNIDQIVATLALKEISQSTLIKKLCTLSPNNKTRKAVFEYNKLIRSIYTLKCILDPKILENAHRSQNRLESYHTLRGAIAKVSGRKALLGQTDLEMEISNQCGLLICNTIILYNASIHSHLLATSSINKKLLKFLKKCSPIAWQHIHFTGYFSFYRNKNKIDISKIVENVLF
jgi:TnpA family transposase